ncbi:MAG: nicotinamide-nucleotide amidohydrolase family protein [Candidatus Omnitrophica bacterium]|nr:nicotinamide-nucleotide amidohydrolase family protein [Candidatus Omnitrophota bacterium]
MNKKPKKLPSSINSYNFRSGIRHTLSYTIKELIIALREKKLTLSLAESCSGGYASYLLTKISGASKVFKGAVVVYSLDTKTKLFNIPSSLLEKTQGVSKEVALKLATGVKGKFNSDIGASIVGFAGPGAKTKTQLGTTFIALVSKNKQKIKKIIIKGSRDSVRKKISADLINLLYKTYA